MRSGEGGGWKYVSTIAHVCEVALNEKRHWEKVFFYVVSCRTLKSP